MLPARPPPKPTMVLIDVFIHGNESEPTHQLTASKPSATMAIAATEAVMAWVEDTGNCSSRGQGAVVQGI